VGQATNTTGAMHGRASVTLALMSAFPWAGRELAGDDVNYRTGEVVSFTLPSELSLP